MTLPEFLLARLAEDEALARESSSTDVNRWAGYLLWARFNPARVLAEVEAKRRIVWRLQALDREFDAVKDRLDLAETQQRLAELGAYLTVAKCLAEALADHPDYDEAWRHERTR